MSAAAQALAWQGFVTPVDVCLGLGWLHQVNVDDWRHGRVDDLEYFLPVHDSRLTDLLAYLQEWASGRGLEHSEAEYVSVGRGQRQLRFVAEGDPRAEAAWRVRWTAVPRLRRPGPSGVLPSGDAALTRRAKEAILPEDIART